jgi:hypothetical protein
VHGLVKPWFGVVWFGLVRFGFARGLAVVFDLVKFGSRELNSHTYKIMGVMNDPHLYLSYPQQRFICTYLRMFRT